MSKHVLGEPTNKRGADRMRSVYLLRSADGRYKIGFSQNPEDRATAIGKQIGMDVQLVHVITTDRARFLEHDLHCRYASRRIQGEWFALTEAEVAEFCSFRLDPWPSHLSELRYKIGPARFLERLKREPFQLFSVKTTEFMWFVVDNPRMVLLGRDSLIFGINSVVEPLLCDSAIKVSYRDVVAIEDGDIREVHPELF